AEAVRQRLEHALGVDLALGRGLRLQDLEDQVLLAQARRVLDGERLGELGELLHRARLDLLDVHAVGVVAFLVVDVLLEDLLVREVHPAPAARIAHAVAAHVAAATAAAAPSASAPAAAALALGGVVHALIRHVGLSSASWVVVGSRPSRRLAPRRIPVLMGWNAAGSRLRSTVRSEPRKWEGVGSRG